MIDSMANIASLRAVLIEQHLADLPHFFTRKTGKTGNISKVRKLYRGQ